MQCKNALKKKSTKTERSRREIKKSGTHAMGNNDWYWLHFVDNYFIRKSIWLENWELRINGRLIDLKLLSIIWYNNFGLNHCNIRRNDENAMSQTKSAEQWFDHSMKHSRQMRFCFFVLFCFVSFKSFQSNWPNSRFYPSHFQT